MKSFAALFTVAIVFCTTGIRAEEFKHQDSGLQFKLPKGWTCTEKEHKIFITNKDKTLNCVGGVIPKESAKAIFADINKFVEWCERKRYSYREGFGLLVAKIED